MKAMFAVLEDYWYVLVFAALGVWITNLHGQIKDQKLQHAVLVTQVAQAELDRERVAREHEAKLAERERTHATAQQEKEDEYDVEKSALRDSIAAERSRTDSLRGQLKAATARSNAGSATDPVACGRAFDRLEAVGGLAAEGVELLREGSGLLQQCERDVRRLWDQIVIDRKATGNEP